MCKASQRGSSSDQRAGVEGSRHALMNYGQFESRHQKVGIKKTYASPSVLKRSNELYDKGRERKNGARTCYGRNRRTG